MWARSVHILPFFFCGNTMPRVGRGNRWYDIQPPRPGSNRSTLVCRVCLQELPFSDPKRARRYHWRSDAVCQGQLQQEQGIYSVVGKELVSYLGAQAHYGKVVYQHHEVVYQGRANLRTQWRVQFEDGEEFDMNYDEIMFGIRMLEREGPRIDGNGFSVPIAIPYDRGEAGHPGAVFGGGGGEDNEDDTDEGEEDEDFGGGEGGGGDDDEGGDEGGGGGDDMNEEYPDGDDDPEGDFGYYEPNGTDSDDDATVPDPELNEMVSHDSAYNVLTYIIQSLEDRKGKASNLSVVATFKRERAAFKANLPVRWEKLLKMLDIPELKGKVMNVCINGDYVWPFLPEDLYESHVAEECPRCKHKRLRRIRGKLKAYRVMWYLGLRHVIPDLFNDPDWAAA